jgi:hypothetical protein
MNEELETKKEWATPEIFDLDVDRTATGDVHPIEISTTAGPS